MFDLKSDKNMFLLSMTFCCYIYLAKTEKRLKALMINTYPTMIRIGLKREKERESLSKL